MTTSHDAISELRIQPPMITCTSVSTNDLTTHIDRQPHRSFHPEIANEGLISCNRPCATMFYLDQVGIAWRIGSEDNSGVDPRPSLCMGGGIPE